MRRFYVVVNLEIKHVFEAMVLVVDIRAKEMVKRKASMYRC